MSPVGGSTSGPTSPAEGTSTPMVPAKRLQVIDKAEAPKRTFSSWANACSGKSNQSGEVDRLEITNVAYAFNTADTTYVDTLRALKAFLPHIAQFEKNTVEPQLALDSEGMDLGRHGTISLMQLYSRPHQQKWVFDVKLLGSALFDTEWQEHSLRKLLESFEYHQTWWDVRQDSDALFFHFNIKLGWVTDGQLVCLAAQTGDRNYLPGLGRTIEEKGVTWMRGTDHEKWVKNYWDGKQFFQRNGYQVFEQRPLPLIALRYAAGDVSDALVLFDMNYALLFNEAKVLVKRETETRLESSRSPNMPFGTSRSPAAFTTLRRGNLVTERNEEERKAIAILTAQLQEAQLVDQEAEEWAEAWKKQEYKDRKPRRIVLPYSYAFAAKRSQTWA